MTNETLEKIERTGELSDIIRTTDAALTELCKLRDGIRDEKEQRYYDDGLYSLSISQHSDGSGINAKLTRYKGNVALLNVMIKEVGDQLTDLEEEFKSL